ncbi:MAG: aldo/keto reductase [Proteobacteria bacterium]|nr:aldo/keto reductase [Pseudomonadota bacterium]MBU1738896.1 aldo/keto reductase [Pseudomonadota bacterium]
MKTVPFGKSGRNVSRVGMGGEGILRTYGRAKEAEEVIREAVDRGITYFDSARVYSDSEVYYGRVWGSDPALRKAVFQTSKSAARDRDGANSDLEHSLKRLSTDYLDLWQIHDIRTEDDLLAISRPGGALEAFVAAKKEGKVRFIGVTGHHDPYILTRAVEEWPIDSVLLPVNPVEELLGGFLTHTLPAARKKGMAVIGMKVLGASHFIMPKLQITPELLIRFAMSFDLTLPIIGCSSPDEVKTLAALGGAERLVDKEKKDLVDLFRPYAAKMAFYRGVI